MLSTRSIINPFAGRVAFDRHGVSGLAQGLSGRAPDVGGFLVSADAVRVIPGTGRTVDGQPLNEIWNGLQERLAAFNRQSSLLFSLLTFPVDRATEKVGVYYTPRMEEATEFGRPQKVRLQYVPRGYPLTHRDISFGYTQEFIDSARGQEITSIQAQVEAAWQNVLFGGALTALFSNTNATDEDGVVVRRLYNADTEIPPPYKRTTHDGTHTHYLTSGAAFDGTDLNAIEEHLLHHGFGDFGESLVVFANRVEILLIRALPAFVPASTATRPAIIAGPIVGATPQNAPGGLAVEGYHGRLTIVELNDIPAGYLLGLASGGSFATQNVVGYRRHENESIRGLRLIEGPRQNYPLYDSVYDGYAGFGVRHRGAAVVMQITAGAYTVPTF